MPAISALTTHNTAAQPCTSALPALGVAALFMHRMPGKAQMQKTLRMICATKQTSNSCRLRFCYVTVQHHKTFNKLVNTKRCQRCRAQMLRKDNQAEMLATQRKLMNVSQLSWATLQESLMFCVIYIQLGVLLVSVSMYGLVCMCRPTACTLDVQQC